MSSDFTKSHAQRPKRLRLPDFHGKMCTLEAGAMAYDIMYASCENVAVRPELSSEADHELCPEPLSGQKSQEAPQGQVHVLAGTAGLYGQNSLQEAVPSAALLNPHARVYVLECPEFLELKDAHSTMDMPSFPKHWQYIKEKELKLFLRQHQACTLWWYRQNMRLFPNFWSKVLGDILAMPWQKYTRTSCAHLPMDSSSVHKKEVILLGCSLEQLLERELKLAFTELGFEVLLVREPLSLDQCAHVQEALHENRVVLFYSLNLQGLDSGGHDFALLTALGIPVALWFVDNPWHVLAALRLPWWKQAHILVTDASFVHSLHQEGAGKVLHIPLATAQHMWQGSSQIAQYAQYRDSAVAKAQQAQCVFVGRASFPQKKSFFAAARVPENLWQQAQQLLQEGAPVENSLNSTDFSMPHFHWWAEKLNCTSLWPGSSVRQVGLGAEQSAQCQRVLWLKGLLDMHVAVFGHAQSWQELLPMAKANIFHADVDYYGELAAVYAAAPAVLNVTSLLLPAGLTQRHFDVWAAGGFLWTNSTSGLSIFPHELVRPVAFTHVQALRKGMADLLPSAKGELKRAWQEVLRTEHSYSKRMNFVLESIL